MKSKNLIFYILLFVEIIVSTSAGAQCFSCGNAPMGTIFCDDFEDTIPVSQKYFEYDDDNGDFIPVAGVGRDSSVGMRAIFQAGEDAAGNLKKSFGRTPHAYIGNHAVYPTQDFNEIYWRIDIRMQTGWTGNPFKLSRALCLANSNWAQGMMAHVWGSGGNRLGIDPASGIDVNGTLVSTHYNDFVNQRWLGFHSGNIEVFDTDNAGKWYCIEARAKLNTPGLSDGIFEFWINDTLEASVTNLNWHGNYNSNPANFMINSIFFENYWNNGSSVTQERYFDNIVISTQRINCTCATTEVGDNNSRFYNVSPNPSAGKFSIINNANRGINNCRIYNSTGQLIQQLRSEEIKEINLSDQPGGIYFLIFEGNYSRSIKLIKY